MRGGKAAVGEKSEEGAPDAIAVRPAPDIDENAVAPRGDSEGVHLPVDAVECVEPLLQEWLGGNRQQYRGERPAVSRWGEKTVYLPGQMLAESVLRYCTR